MAKCKAFFRENCGGKGNTLPPACDALSSPANHTAGNFLSSVPGGLGHEIVRTAVNHNCPAYDIAYAKPACQHLTVRPAVIAEQRGKVTGVLWMRRSFRIEMTTRVREATAAAVITLMDMKSKEAGL